VALLVNERGQIAGNSYTSAEPSEACAQAEIGSLTTGAFLWDKGTMLDLGDFGGTCTFAFDLNNRGQVVGGSRLTGDQVQHPFLWDKGSLIDLGTLGGNLGTGIAINDAGDVAGWSTLPGDQTFHAALWRQGKLKDLGTVKGDVNSIAFHINALGQVVGVSVPPDGDFDTGHPFLWEDGGPMIDLNKLIPPGSSLQLTEPATINDRGEIAGNGFDADGNQHAFLLIPCDDDRVGRKRCEDDGQDGNSQAEQGPITSPAMTDSVPNKTRMGLVVGARPRFARGHHLPTLKTPN
jgi:probable HAF family extracellular repeat protein